MKVRCEKILSIGVSSPRVDLGPETEDLTVGKEYVVLEVYLGNGGLIDFYIETNCGDLVLFEADQFSIVSNYIPSNWEMKIQAYSDRTYYFSLSPRNWSNATFDFHEEITEVSWPLSEWREYDKVPEAVALYFQERDLIYREEEEYAKKQQAPKL